MATVVKAVDRGIDERDAVLLGELRDLFSNETMHLFHLQNLLWSGAPVLQSPEEALSCLCVRHVAGDGGRGCAPPDVVDRHPMGNRAHPSRELGLPAKRRQAPEDPQERLLDQVLDDALLTRCPPDDRAHEAGVHVDQSLARAT